MCKAIQKAIPKVRHGDVGIVACRHEHGKGLDVNIWDVFLARECMSANRMNKGMNDEIGILTGFFGLTENIRPDCDSIAH